MKILVADDDADLRALLGFTLAEAGYEICPAHDGRAALQTFELEAPEFALLDINMPGMDGIEVCRQIRQRSRVPIMMLTVRDQEEDLIAAFEAGADDYVRKPFSPRALLARVRALLRRADPATPTALTVGDLHLDALHETLHIAQRGPIRLTPLELKALRLLMASPGRTITAETLFVHLWGGTSGTSKRTLKQIIYRLRHKIEIDPSAPRFIQTTPNAGYKLAAD